MSVRLPSWLRVRPPLQVRGSPRQARWLPRSALPLLALAAACSGAERDDPGPAGLDELPPPDAQLSVVNCGSPEIGCPCVEEGQRIECGTVSEQRGNYAICSMGTRLCSQGLWGGCEASRSVETTSAPGAGGLRLQALSSAQNCKNLCDPECMAVSDDAAGLLVDDDLLADPSGLTLPGGSWAGSCNNIAVSPAASTITITAIASNGSVTASPASLALSASCAGAVIEPSWTIDAYDRAVINGAGSLTVFSGIASPILATAASSVDSTTALVNVVVNIEDRGTNSAVATALDGAGVADSGTASKTLYPYRNTVFPLDLKAPLVQWDPGSNGASAVQVALRFPAGSSSPRFSYSKIFNTEPKQGTLVTTAPAWQIPQEIWSAFDRSAAGDATGGEIIIQRYYSGQARTAMTIPVRFASAPLSGTVYYTQYLRSLYTASTSTTLCSASSQPDINPSSYVPGNICPVGLCTVPGFPFIGAGTATTRAIDLSTPTAPNKDPFNGTAGCPVCHSVSADGTRHVSTNQSQQTIGGGTSTGINDIGVDASGDPFFSPVGATPNYSGVSSSSDPNSEASYGFSYGAIVPDGSLLLQGPNYWGNTLDTPASNNTQDATMKGVTNGVKPYFFVHTDQPGAGVQFATRDPLPSNTRSGNVLTASAAAALSIDGQPMAANYSVLVKDESDAKRNGIYTVSNAGSGSVKWTLTRRSDADGAGELTPGMEVRVSDGNFNRGKVFYISSPAAGNISVNSTSIGFSQSAIPAIAYTSAPLSAKYATSAALSPATVSFSSNVLTAGANGTLSVDGQAVTTLGDTVLVKDEGTASRNGLYTLTQVGSSSAKWKLTRHSSLDTSPSATSDATPGMEIRVSGGASNAGKVFRLSSPASGTVTINTSNLVFEPTELPSMMVPVVSPDGSKVAYVNADADLTGGLANTGWRRGLSMFSFDQATLAVSKKKRLLNTWSSGSAGTPIKWPFFESDSHSLLYVQSHANEYCSSSANGGHCAVPASDTYAATNCSTDAYTKVDSNIERACFEGSRGSMTPTTRGFWPGRIYSLDSTATNVAATVAEMAKLNDGDDDGGADDATDAGKSYQPTVLPFEVGGYRWVIFTSPRPYGNQFNMKGTHFSCGAPMLWVAALDARAADGTDRSHPAFFLPGQNVAPITSLNHYLNERGYLVPSLCKDEGARCNSNSDCCADGSGTDRVACRAPAGWKVADGPPAKTCQSLSGTCSNAGQACSTPDDCCNGAACVNFVCEAPPTFEQAEFTREYDATCPADYQPQWQVLSYYLTTDSDSRLHFELQTAHTLAGLDTAPVIDLGDATDTVVSPDPPAVIDVNDALNEAYANGKDHLRLVISFIPSSDGYTAPVLHDWEMMYTCVPAQ